MAFAIRFLNRQPLAVSALIVLAAAWAFQETHDFVVNTVQPRQQAALRARVEAQIAEADTNFKRRKYPAALSTYRYVLAAHTDQLSGSEQGTLHHRIGLSFKGLADRAEEKENLTRAIAAFREALAFRAAADDPQGYGETQGELGLTQARLALTTNDSQLFDAAIAAFGEAIKVRAPDQDPKGFAALQIHIGNAHRERFAAGEKQNDAQMNPALTAYDRAESISREQEDMEIYARANLERAQAHLKLAEGIFKRTNTRAALTALDLALEVLTSDSFPREYGRAQRVLGDVYMKMYKDVPVQADTAWRASQQRSEWQQSALRAYELASQFGAMNTLRSSNHNK